MSNTVKSMSDCEFVKMSFAGAEGWGENNDADDYIEPIFVESPVRDDRRGYLAIADANGLEVHIDDDETCGCWALDGNWSYKQAHLFLRNFPLDYDANDEATWLDMGFYFIEC